MTPVVPMPRRKGFQKPRYTQVPDILFDSLLPELEDGELRVLMVIIRKTIGWQQKQEDLSLCAIAKLAGISKSTVVRATESLIEKGLMGRTRNVGDESQGQIESTYWLRFDEEKDEPPVSPMSQGACVTGDTAPEPPMSQAPVSPMSQVIGRYLNTKLKTEETPVVPFVDFQTFLHRWSHHRGFKKPQKHFRERIEVRWQSVAISEEELTAALDGYRESDWAKSENYPILGFVKDPHSWIPAAAPEAAAPSGDTQPHPAPADAPQGVFAPITKPRIDYPARWNELVPSKPVTWDSTRSPGTWLRACEADPVFCERFDFVCQIAEAIHQARGSEVEWLTFEFAIKNNGKGVGWWRILSEFRSMAEPKPATYRSGRAKKTLAEIMQEGKSVHPRV